MLYRGILLFLLSGFVLALYSFPEVGMKAIHFSLQDLDGTIVNTADYEGKIIVLEWYDPSCVFVKKHYESGKMQTLQKRFGDASHVAWLQIVVQDENIDKNSLVTHQLFDSEGSVSALYGINKAPTLIVINKNGRIAYMGAVDSLRTKYPTDAWKAKINYIDLTLSTLVNDLAVKIPKTRPYGCKISVPDHKQFG